MTHHNQVSMRGVGILLSPRDKKGDTKKTAQTPRVFSQSEVSFLAHSFFFSSILHPPVMLRTVVSLSTFKPPHRCVGPQNIHLLLLHRLYHLL